ncbi:hypothetical protein G7046_g6332 [Stylonectria norvegica]|nr:hypothetical protein G7046_g6332 [Stylonectria norvegica]
MTMNEKRDYFNQARVNLHREFYGTVSDNITISDIFIPTRDNSSIPARLYQPNKQGSDIDLTLPLLIHLHSGGWHLGTLDTEGPFCAFLHGKLVEKSPPGFAILDVCYRHTPEHHFPTQIDDVYDALQYFSSESDGARPHFGLHPDRIILSGTSAGAHLAIACTVLEMQRLSTSQQHGVNVRSRISGLILTCPPTVHVDAFPFHLLSSKEVASLTQNSDDPMLGIDRARLFWGLFLGPSKSDESYDSKLKADATISPLIATEEALNLSFWPPTSFHVAGMDCLRDEGLLFEEKLRLHQVKTRLQVYSGFPHAFNMLPQLKESHRWRESIINDILTTW